MKLHKLPAILDGVGIALFAAGAAWNAYRLSLWEDLETGPRIIAIVLLALCLLFLVQTIAFFFLSAYFVKGKKLVWQMGLFRYSVKIGAITEVVFRERSKDLFVFYGEDLMAVYTDERSFSAFVDELKAAGGTFTYSIDYQDLEDVR